MMIWLIHDPIEMLNVNSIVVHDTSDLLNAHLLSSVEVYSICFLCGRHVQYITIGGQCYQVNYSFLN